MPRFAVLLLVTLLAITQSACIAVGYTSGGGWSVWPGGIGLVVMIGFILFSLLTFFRR